MPGEPAARGSDSTESHQPSSRSGAGDGGRLAASAAIFSNCFGVGIRQDAALSLMGELEHKENKSRVEKRRHAVFGHGARLSSDERGVQRAASG
jgi:hypothetical protein